LSTLIEGEVGSEGCCLAVFANSDLSEGLGDRGVLLVDVDKGETRVVRLPRWVNARRDVEAEGDILVLGNA
jgi:hypothetical protein